MAGALTPKQRWAVIQAFGTEDNALREALRRSPELQELWDSQYTAAWWPHTGDFWKVFWERALFVLGLDAAPPAAAASTSKRGRRKGSVSVLEANRAAAIYAEDPGEYDNRDDGGAYAVHALYIEDREPGPSLLSRPMVGHLIRAIRSGWLPWDPEQGQLRISDEFRTSRGMFVIPRRKPT
jgi:hypothetical protein